MKKTCNGCYAFEQAINKCSLNYKLASGDRVWGIVVNYKPLEDCPKPKTIKEYYKLTIRKGKK